MVQVSWRGGTPIRVSGARGRVCGWSAASRRRLLKVAGSVDWEGVRAEWGGAWLFLTLTYREDPGPERCKRDLDVLARRWARRWGHARWLWKMEFQGRGVPHFHFLGWVPKDGAVALAAYRWWLWDAWREIAGAGVRQRVDVDYARARDMVRYFVAYASTGGRQASTWCLRHGTSRPGVGGAFGDCRSPGESVLCRGGSSSVSAGLLSGLGVPGLGTGSGAQAR